MNNKLIFFSLIIVVTQAHAMKQKRKKQQKLKVQQKIVVYTDFPKYELLDLDIRNAIIDFSTNNTVAQKPKEATKTVNALARTSKKFNTDMNDQKFSDNVIKTFANKYRCSQQTIARYLHTKQSKKRLFFQNKLKQLCCFEEDFEEDSNLLPQLTELVIEGIDLEFTYNHLGVQKTPLMISMNYDNNMFQYLLEHEANINGCNSYGITALHYAVDQPINEHYVLQLTTNPTLAINQQNKRGDNALLRCLTHRKKVPIDKLFIATLKTLLKKGGDPELANTKRLTPLIAAQKFNNRSIRRIIQKEIDAKYKLI